MVPSYRSRQNIQLQKSQWVNACVNRVDPAFNHIYKISNQSKLNGTCILILYNPVVEKQILIINLFQKGNNLYISIWLLPCTWPRQCCQIDLLDKQFMLVTSDNKTRFRHDILGGGGLSDWQLLWRQSMFTHSQLCTKPCCPSGKNPAQERSRSSCTDI